MLTAALLGFAFGFIGSMPIAGPIAILVFGRGLEGRAQSGMRIALGASLAEGAYAYLAFWGMSRLVEQHAWLEPVSRGAGAVVLTGLGVYFVRRRPTPDVEQPAASLGAGPRRSFLLGLAITGLNPALIANYTAAVTTVHSMQVVALEPTGALPFGIGAALGVAGWFAVLLLLLARLRSRFRPQALDRVLWGMGIGLIGLGMFFAYRFVAYISA